MSERNIEYIECGCYFSSHLMKVEYHNDEECRENGVIFQMQLSQFLPFHKRLWYGMKYIFGVKDHGCDWADTIVDTKKEAEKIKNLLDKYLSGE